MINVTSFIQKNSYPCFATQTFSAINKSNFLKFESECLFLKKEQIKKHEIEQNVTF